MFISGVVSVAESANGREGVCREYKWLGRLVEMFWCKC